MSIYDDKYEIRYAKIEEITEVMEFIEKYWKSGHILARDRKYFEYEHVVDGRVNFLIAKSKESGVIHGILGFLPSCRDEDKLCGWDVIWKVREDICPPMLGVELKKRLAQLSNVKVMLSVGDNPRTSVPILRVIFKYFTAKMKHYYCISKRDTYVIAKVAEVKELVSTTERGCYIQRMKDIQDVKSVYSLKNNESIIPYKDYWYIEKRYFNNPYYEYQIYGLGDESDIDALLVCREQCYCGAQVLRIVDFIGNEYRFRGLNKFFRDNLSKYEYIDFYCYGLDEDNILASGMIENDETDLNIIPDYFNPYEAVKVDIWVGTSTMEKCKFFKADADQDRPC